MVKVQLPTIYQILLKKAGQKTGLFVSPYVYRFNERIQLDNQDISDQDLIVVAKLVQKA